MTRPHASLPIGVFDSGVGGLTVLNALRKAMPHENLIYLGDTARVPYGTKSSMSVIKYAEQAAAALVKQDIKLLIIACNTASAVAIEPLQRRYPQLKVMGVIKPGAEACCQLSVSGTIGVIATESTVNNQAYEIAIKQLNPAAAVVSQACSLFVALAEEGWHEGELVEQIIAQSLRPLMSKLPKQLDTLVLGCTHFPVLKSAIAHVLGPKVSLVDSAQATAQAVSASLAERELQNPQTCRGEVDFLVTDGPERFARVARNFYDESIACAEVQLVDI